MAAISRRMFVAGGAALAAGARPARAAARTLRVGFQKYGNLLLLKTSGVLEQTLEPLGWRIEWRQFLSGPPLLEALAAGAIDFGSAGETPPIFAQAAGAPIVYRAYEPPAPKGEAIIVRRDSPIKTLADLRGKKVALNKGSNVHYLFVKALRSVSMTPRDVMTVFLSPPDGRAAFERGSVDAWVVWDPFLAAAEATGRTRMLADGTGLVSNRQYYISHRRLTDKAVLAAIHAAIAEVDRRAMHDPAGTAAILSPSVGLPADIVLTSLERQTFAVAPIDKKIVADQQAIADTFYDLRLIPKPIKVADALA